MLVLDYIEIELADHVRRFLEANRVFSLSTLFEIFIRLDSDAQLDQISSLIVDESLLVCILRFVERSELR